MSVDTITASILSKAQFAADERLSAAENTRREKLAAVQAQIDEEKTARDGRVNKECAEISERRLTLARLESRIAVLGIKQRLIEKAYALAAEKLENMPADDYRDMYSRLISQYAEKGDVLLVGSGDAKVLDKKWAEKTGIKSGGSFDGSGVILSGSVAEKDLTRGVLLLQAREKTESAVAKILFGREQ